MRNITFSLLLSLLSLIGNASASGFAGAWEYVSPVVDSVYGEPEKLELAIRLVGPNKLCGSYMSAYRGGMKVAEGEFTGTITGDRATIIYEAGWGSITGSGEARVLVRGKQLEWSVLKSGPEPDYMIRSAKLKPAISKLSAPSNCK